MHEHNAAAVGQLQRGEEDPAHIKPVKQATSIHGKEHKIQQVDHEEWSVLCFSVVRQYAHIELQNMTASSVGSKAACKRLFLAGILYQRIVLVSVARQDLI